MSRLSTSCRRVRVDRVVAEQLLGGLEAGERRRPLARVLLAVEEHADLGAVAALADPQHRSTGTARAGRGRSSRVVRKSDRLTFARGWTMPSAGVAAEGQRHRERVRAGLALIAATTCAAVLDSAPVASVARLTRMSFPITAHAQRRVGDSWVDELGRDVVPALVAPGAGGEHDAACGPARRSAACCPRRGVVPAMFACALRW